MINFVSDKAKKMQFMDTADLLGSPQNLSWEKGRDVFDEIKSQYLAPYRCVVHVSARPEDLKVCFSGNVFTVSFVSVFTCSKFQKRFYSKFNSETFLL